MQGIFFKEFTHSYIPEILTEIYRQRVYAPFLEGKKDLTILDIGGNIGLFSFYASQFAKKVYTVEPANEHIDVIHKMVEFNKLKNIVSIHSCAIAKDDGEMELFHNNNVTMFSLKEAVKDPSLPSEKVKTYRLDTFMQENDIKHVDFMKLDIEGAEMDVICGDGFEKACKSIDSLVVEYHQWSGRNPSQLVTALQDYGYEVQQIPSDAMLFGARRLNG